ncbi:MAG: SIS domain-containing protein [Desulfobacterales bacterium]|nr:SIS domain-containing protein [Desulfobacterales bacterium]
MKQAAWNTAKQAFSIESEAILEALTAIDKVEFGKAVNVLAKAERIACSGCGHSGIACTHFAHLLCCIERPARFLSPADAVHGGTGFLQKDDVLVVASRGGKSEELLPIEQIAKEKGANVIALTENIKSPLAVGADIVLAMKVIRECDKYNCQGTTSFVVLSAIFDALQAALIEETGYKNEKFAIVHPGGAVGKRLNKTEDHNFRINHDD